MSSFKGKERFRGVWMNIKDTAFLLKVLSKVEVKIEDAKQAENTINKIKSIPSNFAKEAEETKAKFNKRKEEALDSSSEYDFKNKGGPIYASQGVGLGTY